MKKKYIFTILVFLPLAFISAQSKPALDTLYARQKEAVLMVSQAIYLDSSRMEYVDVIRELEKGIGFSILDTYLKLGNGTAFFISEDGHAITNEHCVKPLTRDEKKMSALMQYLNIAMRHLAPGYASQRDIRSVSDALVKYAEAEPVVILLVTSDKKEYIAEIVATNQKDDLALLKIDLETKNRVIPVVDDVELREGQDAYSIGFPWQMYSDYYADKLPATLTGGIISALRTEKWDIQHTAALNFGNSGGPLFRQDGVLIGINCGLYSNQITTYYYAIGVKKMLAWLTEIGKTQLTGRKPQ